MRLETSEIEDGPCRQEDLRRISRNGKYMLAPGDASPSFRSRPRWRRRKNVMWVSELLRADGRIDPPPCAPTNGRPGFPFGFLGAGGRLPKARRGRVFIVQYYYYYCGWTHTTCSIREASASESWQSRGRFHAAQLNCVWNWLEGTGDGSTGGVHDTGCVGQDSGRRVHLARRYCVRGDVHLAG